MERLNGHRLCRARLTANLTQAALAEQAELSLRTVGRLELGEVATQLSGFLRVCRVLGLIDRLDNTPPDFASLQARYQSGEGGAPRHRC